MPEDTQCESWLVRAIHRLHDAESNLKCNNYSESMSASQESIELSIKAIFSFFSVEFPKAHKLNEGAFKNLYNKIPQNLKEEYNYPRVFETKDGTTRILVPKQTSKSIFK